MQEIKTNEEWKLLVLKLKRIKNTKGFTDEKLAKSTGLKQSNVNRIWSLKYSPNLKTLSKICEALDYKLELIENDKI